MLLEHRTHLFLEGKELLLVFPTHGPLHGTDVLLYFLLFLLLHCVLDLDFLLDPLGLLRCELLRVDDWLLYRVFSWLLFEGKRLFLFVELFGDFFWDFPGDWGLFVFVIIRGVGYFWRHFVLGVFGL